MGDVQLFIVSWIFAGVSIFSIGILLYTSVQIFMHKIIQQGKEFHVVNKIRMSEQSAQKYRRLSILSMFSSSVAGIIISYVNWIPATEYNYDTVLFRLLSPSISIFLVLIIVGIIIIYAFTRALN
ncbi:MAG: hypothetical protein ACFFDD_09265 [Promethearchaeota archaeon]